MQLLLPASLVSLLPRSHHSTVGGAVCGGAQGLTTGPAIPNDIQQGLLSFPTLFLSVHAAKSAEKQKRRRQRNDKRMTVPVGIGKDNGLVKQIRSSFLLS